MATAPDRGGSDGAEEELEHLEQIVARQLTAEEGFVEAKRTDSSPRVKTPAPLTTSRISSSLVEEISPFRATPAALEAAEVHRVATSSGEESPEDEPGDPMLDAVEDALDASCRDAVRRVYSSSVQFRTVKFSLARFRTVSPWSELLETVSGRHRERDREGGRGWVHAPRAWGTAA
jgi:hypothetical protein